LFARVVVVRFLAMITIERPEVTLDTWELRGDEFSGHIDAGTDRRRAPGAHSAVTAFGTNEEMRMRDRLKADLRPALTLAALSG
jgi:hypothetical protein